MKIGKREFVNESALCAFLENLVKEGEEKMGDGTISALSYEDILGTWDDLLTQAEDDGRITGTPRSVFQNSLAKTMCKPYPNAAIKKAHEEISGLVRGRTTK